MKFSRSLSYALALALCAGSGVSLVGCKAEVKLNTPPPPPPPPPPADQDKDGIPDSTDKCVTEAEDGNPPDAKDGCPNKDMDNDGVPIPQDKCPDQAETVNDFEDDDGCPDTKPIVQLKEKEVQINQKIQFKKDSSAIEPESQVVIDAVADVLVKNPDVQLVVVEGHASKEGQEKHNRTLTQQRVESVVKGLIAKGVAKDHLLSQGYGFYCPLDPGDTPEALEKNRRVEFKIAYRAGKKLDITLGCPAAEAKGIKPPALTDPNAASAAKADGKGGAGAAAKDVKESAEAVAKAAAKAAAGAKPAAAAPAPAAAPAAAGGSAGK
ncbi:MAG TPA: OmpA family protein [Polyangiaceae bacterium]|nr:OmpA family protein [Polyangiaceae bacterium]